MIYSTNQLEELKKKFGSSVEPGARRSISPIVSQAFPELKPAAETMDKPVDMVVSEQQPTVTPTKSEEIPAAEEPIEISRTTVNGFTIIKRKRRRSDIRR